MFGFQSGESADTVARKRDRMRGAMEVWSFLSIYDLSTVRTAADLTRMVRARSCTSEEQAVRQVQAWMQDNHV